MKGISNNVHILPTLVVPQYGVVGRDAVGTGESAGLSRTHNDFSRILINIAEQMACYTDENKMQYYCIVHCTVCNQIMLQEYTESCVQK